jgi:glycerol uptake facilitator-like aquaporin
VSRRLAAEFVGTALLLAVIVGSGIMAESLSAGNQGVALLANAVATGAGLVALILTFGPVSGAHFNPLVTAAEAALARARWREVLPYWTAQILGALAGVALAHGMFERDVFSPATHVRSGGGQLLGETLAAFGLLAVIGLGVRQRPSAVPWAVGAYITAGYWFTSSTSFANPAVTVARALSDTFAGIRPADVPGFLVAQFLGAFLATCFVRWISAEVP